MTTVSPSTSSIGTASVRTIARQWRARAWVLAPVLVALALAAGYQAMSALETPGSVIRHELVAAGAATARLSWSTPLDDVQQRVAQPFVHYRATVDPRGFPAYVKVTLHGLDAEECRDAERFANRIEGQVVIVAEGRAERDACRADGVMTWRVMP